MRKGNTWISCLLLGIILVSAKNASGPVVNTDKGPVQGYFTEDAQIFQGIPFALPPTGPNRWQPPKPAKPWGPNPIQATQFTPACPQICWLPPNLCYNNVSEDCLYLNVYAPLDASPSKQYPVMVFIYGGAFFQGTSSVGIYSGEFMAKFGDVVVVTGNYRVGALGFLYNGKDFTGNYGLQDQRLMLQWVQSNIENFGGDPTSVTLFGESAGAISTATHIISPYSTGLFHRAIIESEPYSIQLHDKQESLFAAIDFAADLNCVVTDTECIRSASVDAIMKASDAAFLIPNPRNFSLNFFLTWGPTIDEDQVPNDPLRYLESSGWVPHIPIMMGNNQNEGVMFVWQAADFPLSAIDYIAAVGALFRTSSVDVLEFYAPNFNSSFDHRYTLSHLLTDYLFSCSTRRFAQLWNSEIQQPVYLYHYDHVLSFYQTWGKRYQYCVDMCCHGSELPFVFHTADQGGFNFTVEEEKLSRGMVNYWTNFAHSGNPNVGPNTPSVNWDQFDAKLEYIHLQTPITAEIGYNQQACDLWDKLGYAF